MSSTVIAKNVQIGADGTASNNFTIFQPATPDGTLRIGNGNTGITSSAVALTSAGNVGIGTSSPAVKLDVAGNATIQNGVLTIGKDTVYDAFINTPESMYFNVDSDGNSTGNRFVWGTDRTGTSGGTEWMRIDSSGNVGIGTSSPSQKLTVAGKVALGTDYVATYVVNNGATNTISQIGDNASFGAGTAFVIGSSTAYLGFQTAGTERARITSTGLFQFNSGYGSVATAYGCRAWVNFNGQGTVAIRSSGNISSITDLGTGSYQVNISTAMPDINYSIVATTGSNGGAWVTTQLNCNGYSVIAPTTSTFRVQTPEGNFASMQDPPYVNVAIFR